MKLDKGQGEEPSRFDLATHEHPLPWHEHVIKDSERFHHLVLRTNGKLEGIFLEASVRTGNELEAFGCSRNGKRDRVILVAGPHCARRQNNHLVSVCQDRRMDLGTAHNNTVRAALYYAQIIIGMLLSL